MNDYFKYDETKNELWADWEKPVWINWPNKMMYQIYQHKMKQYNSRPHYSVSPELAKLLVDGQRIPANGFGHFECDVCDGCGWYEGGETLKTHCTKCDGKGAVAIPLPIAEKLEIVSSIKTNIQMEEKTLGEVRVRTDFSVSGLSTVDTIKQKSAELINIVNNLESPPNPSEAGRLKSLAMTAFEEAAMWAVKAATS